MKRLIVILLMISVGLNVGLLLRVTDDGAPWASDRHVRSGGEDFERPGADGPRGNDPENGRSGDRQGRNQRYEGLEVTDEQHQRLAALRGLGREGMETRREEMRTLFSNMQELLLDETIDPSAVAAVRRRVDQVRAEVDSLVADHLLMELEVMTPEQREIYLNRMPWERSGRGVRARSMR